MWLLWFSWHTLAAPSRGKVEVVDWVETARIAGAQAQLPQYRGPATGGLPAVQAVLSDGPSGLVQPLLLRLDPRGERSVVSESLAVTLGFEGEQPLAVDRLEFGEVVLEGVRLEIVPDDGGAPSMVLGFAAIDELDVVPGRQGVLMVVGGGRRAAGWVGLPRDKGGDGTVEAVAAARARFSMHGRAPADRVKRARALDLGGALWEAGRIEEALEVLEPARILARDRCTDLVIDAERVLAWAGSRLRDEALYERVVNSLITVTRQWQTHAASEEPLPPLPRACQRAPGLLWSLHEVLGDRERREQLPPEIPSVQLAQGMYGLGDTSLDLDDALATSGIEPAHVYLWRAARAARAGKRTDAVESGWSALIASPEPSVALALALVRVAEAFPEPSRLTTSWVAASQGHVSATLAHAWITRKAPRELEVDPNGSQGERAAMVAWYALHEDWREATAMIYPRAPETAEWWAGRAYLAHQRGDMVTYDQSMAELRLRFPLHPAGSLGVQ